MRRVLTFGVLHEKIGAGRSRRAFAMWLRREEALGRFPARLYLSPRCLAWEEDAVDAWLTSRPRGPHAEAA